MLWLSATGIALNNASAWGLDRSYVELAWLLRWYGIAAPEPSASFRVGGRWATLLGERLYFGDRLIASGVSELTGAVHAAGVVAISTEAELFLLTPEGALVERVEVSPQLPGRIDALGVRDGRIVCRSGDRSFVADEDVLTLTPDSRGGAGTVSWSRTGSLPADALAAAQDAYLSRVLTFERLLADLHGGRLFTRLGPRIIDFAGVLLILLGVTGLMVWSRRS